MSDGKRKAVVSTLEHCRKLLKNSALWTKYCSCDPGMATVGYKLL